MASLLRELRSGSSSIVNDLHHEICRVLDEVCEGDAEKRRRLKRKLVGVIGTALAEGDCGEALVYKLKHVPQWAWDAIGDDPAPVVRSAHP